MTLEQPNRKTKILATVGPASSDEETLSLMIRNGVNGFRFNFSHGGIEEHTSTLERVRRVAREMDQTVCCLADLQGPKIRIGELEKESFLLTKGEEIALYPASGEKPDVDYLRLPITHDALLQDLTPGMEIYFSDGQIKIIVVDEAQDHLLGRVRTGGTIWSRKGVNIPEADLSVEAMTDKDHRDLAGIVEADFDMVALSFVRRARDLEPARQALDELDRSLDLIAKVESSRALENLDDIISKCEGIMVARGDLGAEIGAERVPFHQKQIIARARSQGKLVITATQMLESMINNPVPTRAEVSDCANAVLDGSDVLMLSGETAVGDYPVESVETMARICRATEADFHEQLIELTTDSARDPENRVAASISNSATRCANELNAEAIVVPTFSGFTARLVSNGYPKCPILGLSPNKTTRQKLSLYRNVTAHRVGSTRDTDRMMREAARVALEEGIARPGDQIVLVAGLPLEKPGLTNFIHVLELTPNPEDVETM